MENCPHTKYGCIGALCLSQIDDKTNLLIKLKRTMKLKFSSRINTILYVMMLLPLVGQAQVKNVISTHRVFPKMDKIMEFESGLAAHAQKYHTGDVSWRVFAIQSGPDAGGYHITEGPTSWEGEDARGDLGAAHMQDWHKNVSMYLTDKQSAGYSVYIDSLSTIALGDFTDKINITHVYPKIGQSDNVINIIRKLKKTWVANGATVAVYAVSSSGPAQYSLVTRYKQGLKERTPGFRPPFKETYEKVNGAGSWTQYLNDGALYLDNIWSELLFMRKDLSSK